MPLCGIELHAEATSEDAGGLDERSQLLVDANARIFEIDRVDRVGRDRHLDSGRAHQSFVIEADQPRQPATGLAAFAHSIEIDEEHRFAGSIRVGNTRVQPARDERKM